MLIGEADDRWQRLDIRAMGSRAVVMLTGGADTLCDWAADSIERLEQSWSRFRSSSELSALNASEEWVEVSAVMAEALRFAERAVEETGGLFDPRVGAALHAVGYDRAFAALPRRQRHRRAVGANHTARQGAWELDGTRFRRTGGANLDLGGIGKGLAADLIATGLVAHGAAAALVSMGGDIRTAVSDGWTEPFRVPLELPDGEPLGVLAVRGDAVASSTTEIRRWERNGVAMHHVIDPRTSLPAETDLATVFVADSTAWRAEVLAKCALILGADAGREFLEARGVAGWLVTEDRRVVATCWAPMLVGELEVIT